MKSVKTPPDGEAELYKKIKELRRIISHNFMSSKVSTYLRYTLPKKGIEELPSRMVFFFAIPPGKRRELDVREIESALKMEGYSLSDLDETARILVEKVKNPLSNFHKVMPRDSYCGWRSEAAYSTLKKHCADSGRLVNVLGDEIYEVAISPKILKVPGEKDASFLGRLYSDGYIGISPYLSFFRNAEFYYLPKSALG